MPNVGKSTLLNSLRDIGIPRRRFRLVFLSVIYLPLVHKYVATPKALRTSAQPGLTRALSTRLKLSEDPLVYSFDTPGVMLPFLGRGDRGAERGVKLALIGMQLLGPGTSTMITRLGPAGIKEGLYDNEALAAYLLYRLNVLNESGMVITYPNSIMTLIDLRSPCFRTLIF